jgi:dienelactone hydrolase
VTDSKAPYIGRRTFLKASTLAATLAPGFPESMLATESSDKVLPGTREWRAPVDIVAEQYQELRQYYSNQIAAVSKTRKGGTRDDLRKMIGGIDSFLPVQPVMEPIGSESGISVSLVQWAVLHLGTLGPTTGSSSFVVREYGLLLTPSGQGPFPAVIALSDADQCAADITGLAGQPNGSSYACELASAGYIVFAPFFVERRTISEPWLGDRSWLFRLAFSTGRHIIGTEVQQTISAIDYLQTLSLVDSQRIFVAGQGQGGMTALYAAALDTRIKTAIIAGYFGNNDQAYKDPEDRMLWGQLLHFGDAEVSDLIAPRELIIVCDESDVSGRVRAEVGRISNQKHVTLHFDRSIPAAMGVPETQAKLEFKLRLDPMRVEQIAGNQFAEWQAYFRNMAMECYRSRDNAWKVDTSSIESYRRSVQPSISSYLTALGRYPDPSGPFDAQTAKLYDEPAFTGYHLQIRVYDGVHTYGLLLLPKSIKAGERRPVVFALHGYSDRPEDVVKRDRLYHRYAAGLAERGYVVFAPMTSVQDGRQRTELVRYASLLGWTPLGLELRKLSRAIDFLSTLPFVDKGRFGIYGLSFGGFTTLRVGVAEPRFRVVISSGDFNETTVKNTDLTEGTSFLFYPITLDRYMFGWLNTFSDGVLASLIAPRAYMTEMGDLDSVIIEPRRWIEIDIARYLDTYRKLGIPQKAGISRFLGPHEIHGAETLAFLDRWLEWTPEGHA